MICECGYDIKVDPVTGEETVERGGKSVPHHEVCKSALLHIGVTPVIDELIHEGGNNE